MWLLGHERGRGLEAQAENDKKGDDLAFHDPSIPARGTVVSGPDRSRVDMEVGIKHFTELCRTLKARIRSHQK